MIKAQIYIDGKPYGQEFNLVDGDSVEFTAPGQLINGKAPILEARLDSCRKRMVAEHQRTRDLEQAIRDIAYAETLNERLGIAYQSGALHED